MLQETQKAHQAPETAADEAIEQVPPDSDESHDDELIAADLLVEDVSIDGMCGVY